MTRNNHHLKIYATIMLRKEQFLPTVSQHLQLYKNFFSWFENNYNKNLITRLLPIL